MALVGGGIALQSTQAFSSTNPDRNANVSAASGGNALVGIVGQGPVKKKSREAMVEFTNNTSETITITVTLDTSSDGTLYDNDGGSGSSVTFTLGAGNSQFVDINADVTGTIGYSVSVSSSGIGLETAGSVESEAGNVAGAIRIVSPNKDQDFTADLSTDEFIVEAVDIRDDDGDDDLDLIEWRVKEGGSGGAVVGSKDVDIDPSTSDGARYNPPEEVIQPDTGYTLKSGTTYSLTVTGYDVDGNFASETVEDTTSGIPTDTPTGTATDTPTDDPPVFDSFNVTKTGSQNRKFDITADVSDPDSDLDRVEIKAIRTQNNQTDYSNTKSVSGGSDTINDTTDKLKNKEEYEIEATVYDTNGNNNTRSDIQTTG